MKHSIPSRIFAGAAGLLLIVLAGCQMKSLEDQLVEKAIESTTGGQVKLDTVGNKMTIKTEEGDMEINTDEDDGTVVVKTSEGEAVMGGGDTRPAFVPSDLPSLSGAAQFSWVGSSEGGMLSFSLASTDSEKFCQDQLDLLLKAGWKLDEGMSMTVDMGTGKSISRSLEMGGNMLSFSCVTNTEEKSIQFLMIKGKK